MTRSGTTARKSAHRLRLSSTTRAIRHALAISAAALALNATAAIAAPTGAFASDAAFSAVRSSAPAEQVLDLTRVTGEAPASVQAAQLTNNAAIALAPGDFYLYNDEVLTVEEDGIAAVVAEIVTLDGAVAEVVNVGDMYAISHYSSAAGVYLVATGQYGLASVDNEGTISADAYYGEAFGVIVGATNLYGDATVSNSGSIGASSGGYAAGVIADAVDYAAVANSGTVSASAVNDAGYYAGAKAVQSISRYGNSYLGNSGLIEAEAVGGYAFAQGAYTSSYYGHAYLDNTGTITASASGEYARALGAVLASDANSAAAYNNGAISAVAEADVAAAAIGLYAGSNEFSSVVLGADGSISASATAADEATAAGAVAYGLFSNFYSAGDISASATADDESGLAIAYGAIVNGAFSFAYVLEDASIVAEAEGYVALAVGSLQYGTFAGLDNAGGISADATGYHAIAVGADLNTLYGSFDNAGTISASAVSGADYGSANATGVSISAKYLAHFEYSEEAEGYVFVSDFHNDGTISASASGYTGAATGVYVDSYYSLVAYNDGEITAEAEGAYVEATGFAGNVYAGYATVVNSGTISASADYLATGVWLGSSYGAAVYNYGLISATGAAYNYAIDTSFGGAADFIYNQGTITGAIRTGAGDDVVYNGEDGTWNATGTSTFADGDDRIDNYGLIAMSDATIDLGYHDVTGNYFHNYGVVSVDGDNAIHMGHGPAGPAVPSLNPNAFYNGGTIDFQDGEADDYLLITGDFAGDGDINVDVSSLEDAADVLYIDGSVVTGTVGTINVDLHEVGEEIASLVPIVYVSGDSVAGNFVLGDVDWDEENSFVTLDFDLVADIDASNADPDVFALGIEVTGLSDPGTLAAAIPGSVQSLMNTQVGTWRQRAGVIDAFHKGAVTLWARLFQDKGSFSPEHHADNFGDGGNFDWEQKNSGAEAGVEFAVTDEFSLGLLVAKSEADTHLDEGNGSSDIDADTWGLYGTWISPTGFYLDASYRWMSFDVDLSSVAGAMEAEGDAESFNLELGYAWTLSGGLKIEPQLQYTKTNVDSLDVFETSSGMSFRSEGGDSSRGRVGVSLRKSFGDAGAGWLVTPYGTLSAVREFDGENHYAINDVLHGETDLEGTSALLELGIDARHQNWSVFGGLNWQDGGAVNSVFGGQIGVRYTFGGAAPAPAPVAPPPAKTCAELDDDGDGVNNCNDKCPTPTGEAVGADGCAVPAPAPEPEPVMEPKPFRG